MKTLKENIMTIVTVLTGIAFIAVMIWINYLYEKDNKDIYALTTIVTEVNYETDIVTCIDFSGNAWEFYGCEDWAVDDYATMIMNNNKTANIYDDIIEKVTYSGYLNGSWGYDYNTKSSIYNNNKIEKRTIKSL